MIKSLHKKGLNIVIVTKSQGMHKRFIKMGIGYLIKNKNIFKSSTEAIKYSKKLLKEMQITQTS